MFIKSLLKAILCHLILVRACFLLKKILCLPLGAYGKVGATNAFFFCPTDLANVHYFETSNNKA
jgi:hypothetical protein